MDILSKNSKTKFSLNFNPEQTCLKDCPVKNICYGKKGRFLFKKVKQANSDRLELFKKYPDAYFYLLKSEIIKRKIDYLRINGNGDTPSLDFAKRLLRLAVELPGVQFWIATRKKDIYDNLDIPKNVIIRYSIGIKGKHRSSVVNKKDKNTCPFNDIDNIKGCKECGYKCFDKRIKNINYLKH